MAFRLKVVAKSDVWHGRELYEVTTDDGEVLRCDGGHLWACRSDTNLRKGRTVVATARELAQWSKANKPCLPRHAPVQFTRHNSFSWIRTCWGHGLGTARLVLAG